MALPVEIMKLSDKELNYMKMCQKAPKCADFSINRGEACPGPPYPRLAPTEVAFMHSVNQNTHINSQTRCYDLEYRLELFSVCERRLLRSHENISCFKYCPPPPPTWNPGCAPAVLSLQCQTFGIQIRLDVLFGLIWVQPVSKDYYFAGFTTGIIPNSWPRILFD